MQQQIQPYLFFEGRTEEALEFYRKALGAETVFSMKYKDSPERTPMPPDKVMHASFTVGGSMLMASDGNCSGKPSFSGFSLSYPAKDEADAKRSFDALAAGVKVGMPLTETFFAKAFGMVTDKFNMGWMITVQATA